MRLHISSDLIVIQIDVCPCPLVRLSHILGVLLADGELVLVVFPPCVPALLPGVEDGQLHGFRLIWREAELRHQV